MSGFGGFGADAGGSMLPSAEVGTFPVVDPVALSVSPYPTIVDPFKRRTALREYFRGLRGENNKENEGVMDVKSPPSLPKQKTLGLCRRHPIAAKVSGEGASLRDKRKFNAPRQTPEKRQRPVESDPGADVPRRLNQLVDEEDLSLVQFAQSREYVELELAMDQVPVPVGPQMVYARATDNVSSSINHQAQDDSQVSLSLFKRQEPKSTPTIRKPLTPVNMNRPRASQVHSSPMPLKPNFSGGLESGSGESLFQLASGKRYQPSAAAKARAASLFESDDADLADLLGFEG